MRSRSWKRDALSAAIALGLHGALLGVTSRSVTRTHAAGNAAREVPIELLETSESTLLPQHAVDSGAVKGALLPEHAARTASTNRNRADRPVTTVEPGANMPAEGLEQGLEAPESDLVMAPRGGSGPLLPGINAEPVWTLPGARGTGEHAGEQAKKLPPRRVDPDVAGKVVADAMRNRDKEIGIDAPASGTIASSVRESAYASRVPLASQGVFEVLVAPSGEVMAVNVVSFSAGEVAAWQEIAESALKRLRATKFTMLGALGGVGGRVRVHIESKYLMPDGSKPGWAGNIPKLLTGVVEVPVFEAKSKTSAPPESAVPQRLKDYKNPTPDRVEVPVPMAAVAPFAGVAVPLDPVNIDARPHRVLRTWFETIPN